MKKDRPAQCVVAFPRNHVHLHLVPHADYSAFGCTCFFAIFHTARGFPSTTTEHNLESPGPGHPHAFILQSNGVLFCSCTTITHTLTLLNPLTGRFHPLYGGIDFRAPPPPSGFTTLVIHTGSSGFTFPVGTVFHSIISTALH